MLFKVASIAGKSLVIPFFWHSANEFPANNSIPLVTIKAITNRSPTIHSL
jgi:hypothetical protein